MDDARAPGLWIDGSCIRQPLRESAALQARRLEVVPSSDEISHDDGYWSRREAGASRPVLARGRCVRPGGSRPACVLGRAWKAGTAP